VPRVVVQEPEEDEILRAHDSLLDSEEVAQELQDEQEAEEAPSKSRPRKHLSSTPALAPASSPASSSSSSKPKSKSALVVSGKAGAGSDLIKSRKRRSGSSGAEAAADASDAFEFKGAELDGADDSKPTASKRLKASGGGSGGARRLVLAPTKLNDEQLEVLKKTAQHLGAKVVFNWSSEVCARPRPSPPRHSTCHRPDRSGVVR
jgi:hypothetical protein